MRVRVDRVSSQKPLVGRVLTMLALKNPAGRGFYVTVCALKNPGEGFAALFALKNPGRGFCADRDRSQKPW